MLLLYRYTCKPCNIEHSECQRFLRAVKWDLPSAFNRAEETVVWRREFEVEKINENPDIIDEEGKTGKEVIMGVSDLSFSDTKGFAEPVYRLSYAFFLGHYLFATTFHLADVNTRNTVGSAKTTLLVHVPV